MQLVSWSRTVTWNVLVSTVCCCMSNQMISFLRRGWPFDMGLSRLCVRCVKEPCFRFRIVSVVRAVCERTLFHIKKRKKKKKERRKRGYRGEPSIRRLSDEPISVALKGDSSQRGLAINKAKLHCVLQLPILIR